MSIEVLGEVGAETRVELREALRRAYETFNVYGELFREAGVSLDDILAQDPLSILRRLPPLTGRRFYDLADESIGAAAEIVDMETSSGTTGPRKRRVITRRDEASEVSFLAELFQVCGIGASDSVACVDTGPLTLMVSFTKALDHLGVEEAYAYCVSPDVDSTVEGLIRLDPSVFVTIPSVLERYIQALRSHIGRAGKSGLRRVVYVGEPLSRVTRSVLENELGVQVFAYYGASETSALGIECQAHDGIHLFTDRNVIEVALPDGGGNEGEILVTTLRQEGLPLLRYALKDEVAVKEGACPCGLRYPRVDIRGRTDGTASILGAKIAYSSIRAAAYQDVEVLGPLEVVLSRNSREVVTVVLPDTLAPQERRIRTAVLRMEPDLAYLSGSGFLALELSFVDRTYFDSRRKARQIVDRREAVSGPSF